MLNKYLVIKLSDQVKAASASHEQVDRTEEEKENIDKELAFQRSKQMKNQMEAYLDRVLLEREVPPGLRDQVQYFVSNQAENFRRRKADESRMLQIMSPLPPQAGRGCKVTLKMHV